MNTVVSHHNKPSVDALARTVRSNASNVSGAIRAARGRVLRAARAKKWRVNRQRLRTMLSNFQTTQHEVEAEVGEFIQSPHLLFRPLRMAAALTLPLALPLVFMPPRLLLAYIVFVIAWYLACLLIFATEVAMRPPWHKKGLSATHRPPYWGRFVHDPKTDLGADYVDVSFPSPDVGTILRGWFVPATQTFCSSRFLVFVHGAGQDRRAFLRHLPVFLRSGYSCLLFDFSEHGLSDNVTPGVSRGTLFGAREYLDVCAAVDYLKTEHGATNVAVIGTSCGASSAIIAAASRPDLAVCVMAENPFARADLLLCHHLMALSKNYLSQNSHQTVRRFIFWLAGKLLMIRMGHCFQSYGAIDAVSSLKCPLFIAHSTEDIMVPYDHGRDIYEAAAQANGYDEQMVKFSSYSDAAHCALYDRDPEKWASEVLSFIDSSFDRAEKLRDTEKVPDSEEVPDLEKTS